MNIRNIAIIAHVDHGKTTLVDKMIYACKAIDDRKETKELILDNNDLEKERGITILSKNVSVSYKEHKINIIDTPGHADFGGEVERVLNMADGVLLLVDAFEGPMPQTRFVLQKAIELGLKPLVVINKVDKENCKPEEVQEKVFDLMFNLDATEEQLDFPTIYGSAKQGWMDLDYKTPTNDILPLLDAVIEHIPAPKINSGTTQLLITSLDYSSFIGRIAIGRLHRGSLKEGQQVSLISREGESRKSKIKELYVFEGLGKAKVEEVEAGDLCAIVGLDGFEIGDTVADLNEPEALPTIRIDEPTMSMLFTINDSPFFGKEGKYVTSRHIKERLEKELERNLALRVDNTGSSDSFNVFGRGVLLLSVLMVSMEPKGDRMLLEFNIPSRGIIGLRNYLLTTTAGEAIMSHRFTSFETFRGEIPERQNGSLISMENGQSIPYSLSNLQDRGKFFVDPSEAIYEGQVVGEHSRANDLVVNITKTKKLTNMRSSGADDKVKIAPAIQFTLEEALEYIQADEYVEVTPTNIRIRKILLKEHERKRAK